MKKKLVPSSNDYKKLFSYLQKNTHCTVFSYIFFDYYLDEKTIRKIFENYFSDGLAYEIITSQHLSEKFIREWKDELNWIDIQIYQRLSENFIIEFKDKLDWLTISTNQKISEKFMEQFKDSLYWNILIKNQDMSEEFIQKHLEDIDFRVLLECRPLSQDFLKRHLDKYGHSNTLIKYALEKKISHQFKKELEYIEERNFCRYLEI